MLVRIVALVALAALVLSTAASAAQEDYVPYRAWAIGSGGDSSWASNWFQNLFIKDYAGYDTTVTFIDNTGYNWHNTVRNTAQWTDTIWSSSATKKAHCVAHVGSFYGLCTVTT